MAKQTKKILRVNPKHPRGMYRIGRHMVKKDFQEFELNEAEEKELALLQKGKVKWVLIGTLKDLKNESKLQKALASLKDDDAPTLAPGAGDKGDEE